MQSKLHNFAKAYSRPKRRSTFSLPFEHKFTGNSGALLPFYCMEVLPGDTFKIRTNYVVRMLQTPVRPVMDNAYLDVYYFFVPSRILWKYFEKFMGVAEPSQYVAESSYAIPTASFSNQAVVSGSVANLLGLPIGFDGEANILPFASYVKIFNEWFRDENIENSNPYEDQIYNLASGASIAIPTMGMYIAGYNAVNSVAKYHDLFTSCLPAAQKYGAVPIMSELAPVVTYPSPNNNNEWAGNAPIANEALHAIDSDGFEILSRNNLTGNYGFADWGGDFGISGSAISGSNGGTVYGFNLAADMSQADTIDQLRSAIALDNYRKKLARGGTRYTELLRSLYGVAPTDARLDRPEYLGGTHKRLNMQQVASTAGVGTVGTPSNSDTGNLGAYSVTGDSNASFIKSFDEFGYVLGLCAVRVKHSYSQGLPKKFTKISRFDYFIPEFDRIGEVPVAANEIFWQSGNTDTFGFQEAWYEYRHTPNRISGAITPGQSADLTAWTYGDVYASKPILSASWIREDENRLQQTLSGTSSVPQLIFDFFVDNKATRPMSIDSVPSSLGM